MRALVGAGACALFLAVTQVAFACEGQVTLLRDDFDGVSNIWQHTTDLSVDGGKLVVVSRPGKSEKVWAGPLYGDADICSDVKVTEAPDLAAAYVGLGFWMTDNKNLYTFQITVDGYAGVFRLKDDKWQTLIKDKVSDSISKGLDSNNTLRVLTVGNKATFYINGDEFGSLNGTPPKDGSRVGLVVEGSDKDAATFTFDSIDVTYPED